MIKPREIESEAICNVLPEELYKDVAVILDLDINIKEKVAEAKVGYNYM